MTAPATATDFLALVQKSGLIDQQTLSRATDELDLPSEPFACADALVRAKLLTTFQAKQLLAGRFRGMILGPYRIQRLLGKGGMGVVYLAEHTALDRKVAVKVLTQAQAREKLALERFFREARSAAALDHPNIVRLYDITQAGGTHFLVMEYVDGTDLQSLVQQTGRMHYAQVATYIAQAAAGLQHAHEKGFVHRDIKPSNLILAKDGTIKILDMGLTRSVANPEDALTEKLGDDVVAGSSDFISPEQVLNTLLDSRSDIYSLGATFCALLTGKPPYGGTTAQKLAQHQMAAPPNPRKIRADIPQELGEVVVRMMAKKPSERFQTAAEVIDALAPWVSEVAPESNQATPKKRKVKASRTADNSASRRKRLYIAGGIAAALVIVAVLAAILSGGSKPTNTQTAGGAPPQEQPQQPSPPSVPPTAPPSDSLRLLTGHSSQVNDLVISPDGTKLASTDYNGKLIIWDTKTGQKLHDIATRPATSGKIVACTTTPDGRYVLVGGERMPILAYDWVTGREIREYTPHEGITWGLAVWSNQRLLSSGNDGAVILRDLTTGNELQRFESDAKLVWTVAFSADGTKFAAGTSRGSAPEESYLIKVWSTADGKELHRLTGHTRDVRTLAFRPDGQVLASGGFDGTLRLWNLNTGKEIRNFIAHDGVVERVFFLPGGRLLTCGGPMSGAKSTFEGGAAKVWDDTGKELKSWRGADWNGLISLMPSKNGQFAAAGGRDRNVRIWSLPSKP